MTRILTAVLLIPFIIGLVLWAPSYLLAAFQLALTEVALWEFFRMVEGSGARPARALGYTFGAAIAILSLVQSIAVCLLGVTVLLLMVLLGWAMLSRQGAGRLSGVRLLHVPGRFLRGGAAQRAGSGLPAARRALGRPVRSGSGMDGGLVRLFCGKRLGTSQSFTAHQPGQDLGRLGGITDGSRPGRPHFRAFFLEGDVVLGGSSFGGGHKYSGTDRRLGGVGLEKKCGRKGLFPACPRSWGSSGSY